jgi:hypothetical protein
MPDAFESRQPEEKTMTDAAIVRIDDTSFLAVARASVARGEGAAAAGFSVVPAPRVFALRIEIVADTLTGHRDGGIFEIRRARLTCDGVAVDPVLVTVRGETGEDLLLDVLSDPTVTTIVGTGTRTASGIELLSIFSNALPFAA